MSRLLALLISVQLFGGVGAPTCVGRECSCAEASCCTPTSGCCDPTDTSSPRVEGCDCSDEGCSDCRGCDSDEDPSYVHTSVGLPCGSPAPKFADADPTLRSFGWSATLATATGPPLHVRNCVWLT